MAWCAVAGAGAEAAMAGAAKIRANAIRSERISELISCRTSSLTCVKAVREKWIENRRVATDRAIVDAIPALIEQAQRAGGGDFRVATCADIATGRTDVSADAVACNFSLLGKESVEFFFKAVPTLLKACGALIVQTLHPVTACGEVPYESGWRESVWPGAIGETARPAPWYFRTLEDWAMFFAASGLGIVEIREPIHPSTGAPASILFIADRA